MRWDSRRRRYVDQYGHVLSAAEVRRRVDQYVNSEQKVIAREVGKVVAGTIFLSAFFHFMQDKIRIWHTTTGVIAYGGEAQMTTERWSRIENKIISEIGYLAGFKQEMQGRSTDSGTPNADVPALEGRANMYADAAYATYENNVMAREFDEGVEMGRRTCEEDGFSCDECVAAATAEFIPLSEVPEIGSLTCLNNCRCAIEYDLGRKDPALVGGISNFQDLTSQPPA